jgi:dihydroxy-acid dehydratase
MAKPKTAVVDCSSEISICFSHLDAVAAEVPRRRARGRHLLPPRDPLVNEIEVQVEGPQFDGMVCLSSCDKTAPAT